MNDASKAHNLSEASLAVWAIQHGRAVEAEYMNEYVVALARNLEGRGHDLACAVAHVGGQASSGDLDTIDSARARMSAYEDAVRTAARKLAQAIEKIEG